MSLPESSTDISFMQAIVLGELRICEYAVITDGLRFTVRGVWTQRGLCVAGARTRQQSFTTVVDGYPLALLLEGERLEEKDAHMYRRQFEEQITSTQLPK